MKRPVKWHRDCLKNIIATLEQEKAVLDRQQAKVSRLEIDIERYQAQLARAWHEGKAEFDRDRYKP